MTWKWGRSLCISTSSFLTVETFLLHWDSEAFGSFWRSLKLWAFRKAGLKVDYCGWRPSSPEPDRRSFLCLYSQQLFFLKHVANVFWSIRTHICALLATFEPEIHSIHWYTKGFAYRFSIPSLQQRCTFNTQTFPHIHKINK